MSVADQGVNREAPGLGAGPHLRASPPGPTWCPDSPRGPPATPPSGAGTAQTDGSHRQVAQRRENAMHAARAIGLF